MAKEDNTPLILELLKQQNATLDKHGQAHERIISKVDDLKEQVFSLDKKIDTTDTKFEGKVDELHKRLLIVEPKVDTMWEWKLKIAAVASFITILSGFSGYTAYDIYRDYKDNKQKLDTLVANSVKYQSDIYERK